MDWLIKNLYKTVWTVNSTGNRIIVALATERTRLLSDFTFLQNFIKYNFKIIHSFCIFPMFSLNGINTRIVKSR